MLVGTRLRARSGSDRGSFGVAVGDEKRRRHVRLCGGGPQPSLPTTIERLSYDDAQPLQLGGSELGARAGCSQLPPGLDPGYDQANAAPGAQQPVYGQPAYGQPSFGQPAFGQPAFGQPSFGQGAYATPPKQWIVALLLAFFVGVFGIHNFYLGYTTRGIIQLVLAITFIGAPVAAIWAFVEFIMIIMRYGAYGCDAQGRPLE